MWTGNIDGIRGFKTYKFSSSNTISGQTPSARYHKDGRFSLLYRINCEPPDRNELTSAFKKILECRGKHLTVTDYSGGAATIEFYCLLDSIPSEETMAALEEFLNKNRS